MPSSGPNPSLSPDTLTRRLGARYLFVLAAVASLVAADQAVVQPLMGRMNAYAPVINIAGRQRMLSQKITKAALALAITDDADATAARRDELQTALEQWSTAHQALRHGDAALGIKEIHSPEIDRQWAQLQEHFDAMRSAANRLVAEPRAAPEASGDRPSVESLLDHEGAFLASMEEIVKLYEAESAAEVRRLRLSALAIAVAIVALLVGLGRFVVRPAIRAIRSQVDSLEHEVAARTGELALAVAELQREVREREQAETSNLRLAAQLAHADRVESMGHLAVSLAHELNQPLGAIANYAEASDVVASRSTDAAVAKTLHEYLTHVKSASLRAGDIIRRIRNFVRPGLGQVAEVELNDLAEEVVDLCRPEAEHAGVALAVERSDQPLAVAVDTIQIQQVLVNLIQNGLAALGDSPRDERRVTVRLTALVETAQVDVIDTGPGLAPADADLLFEPFHTSKEDGLGMGLPICRSIVEHHHGTIWARSAPDGGAQFSFILPRTPTHDGQSRQQPDRVCR